MNRIKELFSNDSKKLIVFITAGFPKKKHKGFSLGSN